jgi:hypothetical protein
MNVLQTTILSSVFILAVTISQTQAQTTDSNVDAGNSINSHTSGNITLESNNNDMKDDGSKDINLETIDSDKLYGIDATYADEFDTDPYVETGVDTKFENEPSVDSVSGSASEVDLDYDLNTNPYEN